MVILPLVALGCLVSLVSWAIIATFLKGYTLLLPLAHVCLQSAIIGVYFWTDSLKNYEEIFYNKLKTRSEFSANDESQNVERSIGNVLKTLELKRRNILLLSVLTSWITPFTVLKNNKFEQMFRNTFLSNRFFVISSLSLQLVTFAVMSGILIGNPSVSSCCLTRALTKMLKRKMVGHHYIWLPKSDVMNVCNCW